MTDLYSITYILICVFLSTLNVFHSRFKQVYTSYLDIVSIFSRLNRLIDFKNINISIRSTWPLDGLLWGTNTSVRVGLGNNVNQGAVGKSSRSWNGR